MANSSLIKMGQGNESWFEEDKKEVGRAMIARFEKLYQDSQLRYLDMSRFIGVKLGLNAQFGLANLKRYREYRRPVEGKLNVINACASTLLSKMSKLEPEPRFLSNGGNWSKKEECKKLNKFTAGVFQQNKVYQRALECMQTAIDLGTGILHVFAEGETIKFEEVYPWELVVEEPSGSIAFNIDTTIQARVVSKRKLAELFPKFADEIALASDNTSKWAITGRTDTSVAEITVYEGYHIGLGEKKGRHTLSVNPGVVLFDEEWSGGLPYSFIKYETFETMFWGMGLIEQLRPLQARLDRITAHIGWALQWEQPWLLINRQSEIVKNTISNLGMAMIKYNFQPPQILNITALNQMHLTIRQQIIQDMYSIAGISELSAASRKPEGVTAGVALNTLLDVESDRFNTLGVSYENFFNDLAHLVIQSAKQIKESGGSLSAKLNGKKFFDILNWNDIDLSDEDYTIECYAVNALPNRPEGRLQRVIDLNNSGMLEEGEARKLLNFEDLERNEDIDEALHDIIEKTVDSILSNGKYIQPDEFDDLQFALKYAVKARALAKLEGAPEDRLELIGSYISDVQALMAAAAPQSPPQGVPGTTPQAPPTEGQGEAPGGTNG